MQTTENSASSVNYDEAPLVLQQVDGVDYRIDSGHGSAVAVSSRSEGTWDWQWVAEGKWDGSRLRVRGLGHPVSSLLEKALALAMKDRSDSGWA
jgi:hypothetical protein